MSGSLTQLFTLIISDSSAEYGIVNLSLALGELRSRTHACADMRFYLADAGVEIYYMDPADYTNTVQIL